MDSSRIFIKNLPSTITAEEFRKHFSQQAPITDAKFLPHRRIGYVGYKTPEDASMAVRHHNKSFLGMVRLKVELARSVDETLSSAQKRRRAGTNDITGGELSAGRQQRLQDPEGHSEEAGLAITMEDKDKLREYLQVMQPPSKSKTWQNQDARSLHKSPHDEVQTTAAVKAEGKSYLSDDEYEHVPKKQKISKPEKLSSETSLPSPPESPAADPQDSEVIQKGVEVPTEEPASVPPTASDTDWLRSRTSRLLGLVDDDDAIERSLDDEQAPEKPAPDTQDMKGEGRGTEYAETFNREDTSNRGHITAETAHSGSEPAANGRLFLRNLAYTTTEDDLRRYFESQGFEDIEDVSDYFSLFNVCSPLSHDEYPDRDILYVVNDVTRKSILVDIS